MANTHSVDLETGSSQYASADNDLGITNGNITIEAWINPESTPGASVTTAVAEKGDAGTDVEYVIHYWNNGGTPNLTAMRRKQFSADNRANYAVTLSNGTWYHVVLTYDGTNCKLYTATQGGSHTERATVASSGDGSSGGEDKMVIGADYNTAIGNYFDGLVDEVRVWNTVRTTANMDDFFETELVGNEAGLVGYYKLNNDYSDSTAGAVTLTASGSPTFSLTVPFSGAAAGNSGFFAVM